MKHSRIFLVGEEEKLIPMVETGYVTEDVMQELIAHYPDLLPGDQIDPENPRRWLLVSREMGVPGDIDEGDRWSLDHLFLDQDGVPTFVECKRASDTRSRREVVAQMLDYAANGIQYWSLEQIKQAANNTAQRQNKIFDDELIKLLNDDNFDMDNYWELVKNNLNDKHIRLLFVMDVIPKELRRLVEFLNEEMTHVEVLAVEIKKFQRETGKEHKVLVPRVIGFTETARSIKQSVPIRRPLTLDEFLEKCDTEVVPFYRDLIEIAKQMGFQFYFGKENISVRAQINNYNITFLYLAFPNRLTFYFDGKLRSILSEEAMLTLRTKLMGLGVLEESGQWSLKTNITKENITPLNQVRDLIFDEMRKIIKANE